MNPAPAIPPSPPPMNGENAAVEVLAALERNGVPKEIWMQFLIGMVGGVMLGHGAAKEEIRNFVRVALEHSFKGFETAAKAKR